MHDPSATVATLGEGKLSDLAGKRILVVEDEALIAEMVADMLLDLGASVIGPAFSLKKAMELATVEEMDGAVLDVNIRSERVDSVADGLAKADRADRFCHWQWRHDRPACRRLACFGETLYPGKARGRVEQGALVS